MRVEEILKEKGFSKSALADKMNTSRQNINSLLKNPSARKIEELADALNVPIWQLFVSPEEVSSEQRKDHLCAFVRYKGIHYTADTLQEFDDIYNEIKSISE